MEIKTLGAIDIGSNAVRMLICNVEGDLTYADFKKSAFLRVPIRLGEDVFTKGKISEEKKQKLSNAMQGFAYLMSAYQVLEFRACGTSAMRDAKNGKEIATSILLETGIKIEIINGQEEADIVFLAGRLDKVMDANRNYLYVDVGGGSTEVILYSNHQKIKSKSFQLGTVRMLVNAVDKKEKHKFKNWLHDAYDEFAPLSVIGTGGNINKIHKILGKHEREYINYPELVILHSELEKMTYEERMLNYQLNTYRADVIIPALEIFMTVCKVCKIKEIYVPKVGIVDGIIQGLYFSKNNPAGKRF